MSENQKEPLSQDAPTRPLTTEGNYAAPTQPYPQQPNPYAQAGQARQGYQQAPGPRGYQDPYQRPQAQTGYGQPIPPAQGLPVDQQPSRANILGIIALVLAVAAGLLGLFDFFWAGLPALAAFILAIVGLFQKGKEKVTSIVALVLSILEGLFISFFLIAATVIGFAAFSGYNNSYYDDSTTYPLPSYDSSISSDWGEFTVAEDDLRLGQTAHYSNGVELTVSELRDYTPSETALISGNPALSNHRVATVTVRNGSDQAIKPTLLFSGNSGGRPIDQISDTSNNIGSGLDLASVQPGQEVSFEVAFSMADPANLSLDVNMGYSYDDLTFTSYPVS